MSASIQDEVKSRYGAVAQSGLSSNQSGVAKVAEAFGYTAAELASIPAEANMGLSCGNPTAMAHLLPGEVVVDLGCGGGIDVLLAARQVGPTGQAIGIDMTAAMIELARRNAAQSQQTSAQRGETLAPVSFQLGTIDQLPLTDRLADCVISNCVINLAPDKPAVFREIHRVLKPGGRLAISDIALKQPLPVELSNDVLAYVGCIAGAISIEEYRQGLLDAGFAEVLIVDSGADLNAYGNVENQAACCPPVSLVDLSAPPSQPSGAPSTSSGLPVLELAGSCCSTTATPATDSLHAHLLDLLTRYNLNEYAASVKIFAIKPAGC